MRPKTGVPFSAGRYRHEVQWNFRGGCLFLPLLTCCMSCIRTTTNLRAKENGTWLSACFVVQIRKSTSCGFTKECFFARSAICEKVGSPNRPGNLAVQKDKNRKSWRPIFWGFYFRPLNSNFLSSFFLGTQYVYPICLFFGFSNTECAFHVSRTREG